MKDKTAAERNRRKRLKKKEAGLVKVETYVPKKWKEYMIDYAKMLCDVSENESMMIIEVAGKNRSRDFVSIEKAPTVKTHFDAFRLVHESECSR